MGLRANVRRRVAMAVCELRHARGLTQQALAGRAGVSVATIRRVEGMHSPLRIDTLSALARGLNVPIEELVKPRRATLQ